MFFSGGVVGARCGLADRCSRVRSLGCRYIAFNSGFEVKNLELPKIKGKKWMRVLDTSMPAPFDFSNEEVPVRASRSVK